MKNVILAFQKGNFDIELISKNEVSMIEDEKTKAENDIKHADLMEPSVIHQKKDS